MLKYNQIGNFYEGNAEELSNFLPKEKYHLIYSWGVLHHTPHPDRTRIMGTSQALPAPAPGDVPPCVLWHTLMSYRTLGLFRHNGSHSCYDYLNYEASV